MEDIPVAVMRFLGEHWPFLGAWVVFGIIIQVLKDAVFTQANLARRGRFHAFYWWGYKTLPLQGMVLGLITGAIWTDPERVVNTRPAAMLYFAVAGALSVFAYQVIKGIAKKRNIDIDSPSSVGTDPSTSTERSRRPQLPRTSGDGPGDSK